MRILGPAILVAILGAALLHVAGPTVASGSTAEGLPSVSLSPDFAEPGETIGVTATCPRTTSTRTVVTSRAFDPVKLVLPADASQPIMTDTATINRVRPGKYTVTSTCGDNSTSSATLTILAAGAPHLVPEGGAQTGGGSTARSRPGTTAALGGALLASGAGLVAVALRRRAARR
jgi:hypothetical protein